MNHADGDPASLPGWLRGLRDFGCLFSLTGWCSLYILYLGWGSSYEPRRRDYDPHWHGPDTGPGFEAAESVLVWLAAFGEVALGALLLLAHVACRFWGSFSAGRE